MKKSPFLRNEAFLILVPMLPVRRNIDYVRLYSPRLILRKSMELIVRIVDNNIIGWTSF